MPLVEDFLQDMKLPPAIGRTPKVAFSPGSTIGNLELVEAQNLLRRVRNRQGITAFSLCVDLVKYPEILIRAYDDTE
ncbi:MAG: L-histidine N(alpha)-methyltransferase [Rhodobacterales bacterium]|nr:L-histidine N(alpha)-methyltransferase [Rhodobacterales bacterium]